MATDILANYAQLGFSFAVSVYVLVVLNKSLKENTLAITALKEEIIRSKEK